MRNFVNTDGRIPFVASGNVSAGAGVVVGDRFGVAISDVANTATGWLQKKGVVTLAKPTNQAFSNGVKLFWDAGNARVTTTEGTDSKRVAGYAYGAAAEAAATCQVDLADGPVGASA